MERRSPVLQADSLSAEPQEKPKLKEEAVIYNRGGKNVDAHVSISSSGQASCRVRWRRAEVSPE